jgi:hypothetical protein
VREIAAISALINAFNVRRNTWSAMLKFTRSLIVVMNAYTVVIPLKISKKTPTVTGIVKESWNVDMTARYCAE